MDETVFSEYKNDKTVVYKGHLWVREMFLLAQYHTTPVNFPGTIVIALMLAAAYPVLERVWAVYVEAPEQDELMELEPSGF
jgi:hypothetical protein